MYIKDVTCTCIEYTAALWEVTEAQEAANTAVKAAQEDAQTTEAAALSEES